MKFEEHIKNESKTSEITTYEHVSKIAADECGLYESSEILQAVRFLKDLGSLQYFENPILKDKIVINPQVCIKHSKKKINFNSSQFFLSGL